MLENLKKLFDLYDKMNVPCVISTFMTDSRRVMIVVVGFEGEEFLGITRDSQIVGHFNPATISEWRDYSGNKTNIITNAEARSIYEKHVRVPVNQEAHDDDRRPEEHQTDASVKDQVGAAGH